MNAILRKLLSRLENQAGEGGGTGAGAAGAADPNAAGGTPPAGDAGKGAAEGDAGAGAAGAGTDGSSAAAGADGTGSGEDGAKKDGAAEKVIPEEYALNMPEGIVVDDEIANEFKAASKDLKLSQEEADRMAAVGAKIVQKQQQAAVAEVAKWKESCEADPEFGGEHIEANRAVAEAGVDLIASQELKDILVATGMSNHPEVFRAFYKLGKMIEDDKFVPGGSRSAQPEKSRAQKMFGGSSNA